MFRERYVGGMPNILMAPTLPTTPLEIPKSRIPSTNTSSDKSKKDSEDKTPYLYADTKEQLGNDKIINTQTKVAQSMLIKMLDESPDVNNVQDHPLWNDFQTLSSQISQAKIENTALEENKKQASIKYYQDLKDFETQGTLDNYFTDGKSGTRTIVDSKYNVVGYETFGNYQKIDDKGTLVNVTDKTEIDNLMKGNKFLTIRDQALNENRYNTHGGGEQVYLGAKYVNGVSQKEIEELFKNSSTAFQGGGGSTGDLKIHGNGIGEFYTTMQSIKYGKTNKAALYSRANSVYGNLSPQAQEELRQKYWLEGQYVKNNKGQEVEHSFNEYLTIEFQKMINNYLNIENSTYGVTSLGKSNYGGKTKVNEYEWGDFLSGQLKGVPFAISTQDAETISKNTTGKQIREYEKSHKELTKDQRLNLLNMADAYDKGWKYDNGYLVDPSENTKSNVKNIGTKIAMGTGFGMVGMPLIGALTGYGVSNRTDLTDLESRGKAIYVAGLASYIQNNINPTNNNMYSSVTLTEPTTKLLPGGDWAGIQKPLQDINSDTKYVINNTGVIPENGGVNVTGAFAYVEYPKTTTGVQQIMKSSKGNLVNVPKGVIADMYINPQAGAQIPIMINGKKEYYFIKAPNFWGKDELLPNPKLFGGNNPIMKMEVVEKGTLKPSYNMVLNKDKEIETNPDLINRNNQEKLFKVRPLVPIEALQGVGLPKESSGTINPYVRMPDQNSSEQSIPIE